MRQWLVYSGALEGGLSTLRRFPEIGIEHAELPKNYRAFRVRRHWICYQLGNQTIEILGIVQDVEQLTETTSKKPDNGNLWKIDPLCSSAVRSRMRTCID